MNTLSALGGATMTSGEQVLFAVVAPIMLLSAASLLFVRRAVHAAVAMCVVMVGAAFLYVASGAPFLGAAQVVVYTGAIMMLFVFVVMLVGVDVTESTREMLRGQRLFSIIGGLGLAGVLGGAVFKTALPTSQGISDPGSDGNPGQVAKVLFTDFPFTLEITGALLIVAALSAVMLTHRSTVRAASAQLAKTTTVPAAPLPAPGVYAGRRAVDVPAIDQNGQAVTASVPQPLVERGQIRPRQPFTQADPKTLATWPARQAPTPPAVDQSTDSTSSTPLTSPDETARTGGEQ
ncbi:MAG: NADH-quinone oxidoreductase subunit J [Bifidobacteriaceae bacterium]|jgi:NADH-quinone oxidoreductase subunit J|nr:NADH-quinone oxidoreductase subunit J [Bifidobacteriaceae bacterium]